MATKIGGLKITLDLDTAAFTKKMKSIGKKMNRIGKDMSLKISAPIGLAGAAILNTAGDFETSMNRLQAVSGASTDQLKAMENQAKDLGITTQFSASQAADAMGFLAQAGFDADKIMASMPGTLKLAAASQIDLATAADQVSNVLSGYGLDVDQLGRATDVMVSTTANANTNMTDLAQAFKFVAPVANAAGVDFEEANAALGKMGDAGIQASMAGTSLRGTISRILAPTKKMKDAMAEAGLKFTDANGKLLSLSNIVRQLEPHANDAGLFMELFGQRAGPAMAALVNQGADSLDTLTAKLKASGGTAEKIADAQMKGFNGAMKELKSAVEGFMLAIADSGLLAFFTDMVKSLSDIVRNLAETNPAFLKWGTIIAGLAAVIGPALVALGFMATGIAALTPIVVALATPLGIAAAAITTFIGAWQLGQELGEFTVNGKSINDYVLEAFEFWLSGDLKKKLKGALEGVLLMVKDMGAAIARQFRAMIDSIGNFVSEAASKAGDFFFGGGPELEVAGVGPAGSGMVQNNTFNGVLDSDDAARKLKPAMDKLAERQGRGGE